MKATPDTSTYPRPDFKRPNLTWKSLNGPWDFIFDDEDEGLVNSWPIEALPDRVVITSAAIEFDNTANDTDTITQKIAALPDNLLKHNDWKAGESSYEKRTIIVPFVFQTEASGVHDRNAHEVVWYEKIISDIRSEEEKKKRNRLILRFGAVDYEATVWADGNFVGRHWGGHVPFDLDITDSVKEKTDIRLTIRVKDAVYDLTQPRGKQYWAAKPESIFYTPSTGIWQSVWLEVVPAARIADSSHGTILRSDDIETGELKAEIHVQGRRSGERLSVEIEGHLLGVAVGKTRKALGKENDVVDIGLNLRLSQAQIEQLPQSFLQQTPISDPQGWRSNLALWSPLYPTLYTLTIRLYDDNTSSLLDTVTTTTGMRHLSWTDGTSNFLFNSRPIFQNLVLDQGYWPQTGITPPNPDALRADIELAKAMGFNGCRKHQKVEDPLFLHYADTLGFLVWGEIANAYSFSSEYISRFDSEWIAAVRRDINHPSIVTWTPVNETWGYPALKDSTAQQNHIRALFYATKAIDPTRPVNDNCGWEHVADDLTTFHDYADAEELARTCNTLDGILSPHAGRAMFVGDAKHRNGAPVLCTEFGGVNIKPGQGEVSGERDWGYTTATDANDLLERVRALAMGVVSGGHVCGMVYTQLTDIEQEVNGLYTFDRKEKLEARKVKAIMGDAEKVFYEKLSGDNGDVSVGQ